MMLTSDEYIALMRLISSERESEGAKLALSSKSPPKKRKTNGYHKFSKRFKFRNKKRAESGADYIAARAKAVGRAWRREKKK
jgi:hypothetical protein